MKKIALLLAFLCTSVVLKAQSEFTNTKWGPLIKTKVLAFNSIIGANNTHYYTIGQETKKSLYSISDKKDIIVKKYNTQNYQLLESYVVEPFEYKDEDAEFQQAFLQKNNEVNLFYTAYDSRDDIRYLILVRIDNSGKIQKPIELGSMTAKKRSGSFDIQVSNDSTKILVYFAFPYDKDEEEMNAVKVFDTDYNELWRKEIQLPYSDKYFITKDYRIANNGDIFVMGYAKPDRKKGEKRQRKESNQFYKLFKVSKNTDDEIEEYDLALADKFIDNIGMTVDLGNNTIGVAGMYSEDRKGSSGGTFYITIDQSTLNQVTESFNQFTKDFLSNFMSERRAEKGKSIGSFDFKNIIKRDDGGAVIIAEEYYVVVHTITDANGNTTTTYTYHYDDIIVINVNPDGSIAWTTYVPKKQSTGGLGVYVSYKLLVNNDKLHFVYNDHRKNFERRQEDKKIRNMSNVKKSVAVIYTIDSDGNGEYQQLFNNKETKAYFVPFRSYQLTSDKVIIVGIKGSKSRFGTLTIN